MRLYLIIDNTAGNLYKITNGKGLIEYANGAHFVTNTPEDLAWECKPASNESEAISILQADLFSVVPLDIDENKKFIHDIGQYIGM